MDVPATVAGTITEVLLKRGDKVSKGSLIARVETGAQGTAGAPVTASAHASRGAAAGNHWRPRPRAAPAAEQRRGHGADAGAAVRSGAASRPGISIARRSCWCWGQARAATRRPSVRRTWD